MAPETSPSDPWWQHSAARPLSAPSKRVMVIGLDGATFDILRPMMLQNRMPNLQRLMEGGASGVLMSTVPPITPAAWTTFMTGLGPGRHGIFDFERYNARTNELRFNSVYEIKPRTIWDILGAQGLRVGSIQLPMTYPPRPVHGFLITGFETPGTNVAFTHPPELKNDILQRWGDFTFKTRWRRRPFGGTSLFRDNLQAINRSFDHGAELARFCGEKYGWDVMMVLYKLVDNLQHKTWKHLDPKTSGRHPQRAALAASCFERLDRCIGQLVEYAESREACVMIMSDHGHGSLDGKIQANLLLQRSGYLAVSRAAQTHTRLHAVLRRWSRSGKGRFAANVSLEDELAIDWTRTRAFVAHAGMCGFAYLNLEGRQPTGIVKPADYDPLREQIASELLALRVEDPEGRQIAPFEAVHKPEVLYDCDRQQYDWLPDLMLVPRPGLVVVRKIRGRRPIVWSSFNRLEGTHRMEGVLIAGGRPFRRAADVRANIVDIAPTLLATLGLRIPDDMEGRVIEELFSEPPVVERQSSPVGQQEIAPDAVYDERQQAILTERLADLGYLE